jgi:steroid 5-alpha reductase family enzyme
MGMDRGWWKMIPRGGGAIAAVFPKAATAALALGEAGRHVFDSTPLLRAQLVLLGVNAVGYILTVTTKSHYHVDLLGTSAFALAAWPSLSSSNQRVLWSARIVAVWSVKLAGYLFYRVLQAGHDARLDEVLDSPYYAAGFWAFSWGWGAIASLPLTVGSTSSLVGNPLLTLVGASVATLGVLIETLADCQKWMFKKKQPRGSFCNAGLWSVSQHPNWFGNMLLWIGVFVMNASALIEPAVAPTTASDNPLRAAWSWLWRSRRAGLAFLSPCFMWYLLSGEATGRILPDAVEAYRKRYGYGTNAEFTKYVDTTPLIIPNPLQMLLGSKTKSE